MGSESGLKRFVGRSPTVLNVGSSGLPGFLDRSRQIQVGDSAHWSWLVATPCLLAEHRRSRAEQFPAASAEREYYFADWRDCIIQSFLPVCSDTANTNQPLIESLLWLPDTALVPDRKICSPGRAIDRIDQKLLLKRIILVTLQGDV